MKIAQLAALAPLVLLFSIVVADCARGEDAYPIQPTAQVEHEPSQFHKDGLEILDELSALAGSLGDAMDGAE